MLSSILAPLRNRTIREEFAAGTSISDLVRRFDLTEGYIYEILRENE
jgi:Mor family transcriptional regulator